MNQATESTLADPQPGTPTHTLPHRGGGRDAALEDPADPAQLITDLQRQLAECRAERDEARTLPPSPVNRGGPGWG
jgi:hypothetical protein